MRVPGIAWWPGKVPAGRVCRELATTMDLFTTCSLLAGAKVPADRPIDGVDILPLLTGAGPVKREPFFFYRGSTLFAVRAGQWKAHYLTQPAYGTPRAEAHDPPLLFNVPADPGERFNVAAQHPEVLTDLASAVTKHRAALQPAATQLEAVRSETRAP